MSPQAPRYGPQEDTPLPCCLVALALIVGVPAAFWWMLGGAS